MAATGVSEAVLMKTPFFFVVVVSVVVNVGY